MLDEIKTGVTRNSPYAGEDNTGMYRWPEQALTPYEMLEAYTPSLMGVSFTANKQLNNRANILMYI
ncbi:hypothetical protein LBYZC6_31510 [Lacrimispora brassicae]